MRALLLSVTLLIGGVLFAQPPDTLWTRVYGGSGNEGAIAAQQTADSGFIVLGTTTSFGAGLQDFYLIKTDRSGDSLWTHTYGTPAKDQAASVRQTSDGGYIMCGVTDPAGTDSGNVYVIKTDNIGGVTWSHTFGGTYYDAGTCVKQTSDGGYIVTGTSGGLIDVANVYLLKLNSAGGQTWSHTFGGLGIDLGTAVQQTTDGGYIIAGFTAPFLSLIGDAYLVKTNSSGSQTWAHAFGGDSLDIALAVQQTSDGGYILAGLTRSFGAGGNDMYVVKTNGSGIAIWNRTYGGPGDDYAGSIQELPDSGFILCGGTKRTASSDADVYLVRINSNGDTLWTKTFGGPADDGGSVVQRTYDDNYFIAGSTSSFGPDSSNVWLIKTTTCADPTPRAPQVTAAPSGSDIQLRWQPITHSVADCPLTTDHYDVYADSVADGSFNLLGSTTDTIYTDLNAVNGPADRRFYVVKAVR